MKSHLENQKKIKIKKIQAWDDNKRKQYEQNQKRDRCALSLIQWGVTQYIFSQIIVTTSKLAWTILSDAYKGSEKVIIIKVQPYGRNLTHY